MVRLLTDIDGTQRQFAGISVTLRPVRPTRFNERRSQSTAQQLDDVDDDQRQQKPNYERSCNYNITHSLLVTASFHITFPQGSGDCT